MLIRLVHVVTACASVAASASTLLIVAGLLTFPTMCACGETLPHDHDLFTLPSHSHEDEHEVDAEPALPAAAHAHQHGQARGTAATAATAQSRATAGQQAVAIEALAISTLGDPHALAAPTPIDELAMPQIRASMEVLASVNAWQTLPEAPPPRV